MKSLRAHANKDENSKKYDSRHTIRVLDANSEYVTACEVRSYEYTIIYSDNDRLSTYIEIDYKEVTSRFYVTPQLTEDNQISLRI